MSGATASAVALQVLDAWNRRDLEAFTALLAEEIEWYDPSMPAPPARGRAAVRAFTESMLRAFPDFTYTVRHPICEAADGSRCAIPWHIVATHRGTLSPPGFAPTNRTARMDGVDVIDVADGRVTRIFTAFDPIAAAEQVLDLRLRPPPGSVRERVAVAVQRVLAWRARRAPPG